MGNFIQSLTNLTSFLSDVNDVSDAISSSSAAKEACNAYEKNPSAEHATAVRDAYKQYAKDLISTASTLLPGDPFSDLSGNTTSAYANALINCADSEEMRKLLEYEEEIKRRENRPISRSDVANACSRHYREAIAFTPSRRGVFSDDFAIV